MASFPRGREPQAFWVQQAVLARLLGQEAEGARLAAEAEKLPLLTARDHYLAAAGLAPGRARQGPRPGRGGDPARPAALLGLLHPGRLPRPPRTPRRGDGLLHHLHRAPARLRRLVALPGAGLLEADRPRPGSRRLRPGRQAPPRLVRAPPESLAGLSRDGRSPQGRERPDPGARTRGARDPDLLPPGRRAAGARRPPGGRRRPGRGAQARADRRPQLDQPGDGPDGRRTPRRPWPTSRTP